MLRTIAIATILTLAMPAVVVAADDEAGGNTVEKGHIDWAAPAKVARTIVKNINGQPAPLPALYVSYAALQVFDVYSTRKALGLGAREANPLMQHVVGNQAAFWAVKASATIGTMAAAERLWRKNHKAAAIAVLVVSNGIAAVVAAHNVGVLRRQR